MSPTLLLGSLWRSAPSLISNGEGTWPVAQMGGNWASKTLPSVLAGSLPPVLFSPATHTAPRPAPQILSFLK